MSTGSPLAPVLANLFMGHNEKDWIDNFLICSIDDMSMTLSVYLRRNRVLYPFASTSVPNTLAYGLLWKRK